MAVRAADGIMDNSPELEFGSPEFAAALAGKPLPKEKSAEGQEETADEKVAEEPESTSDEAESEKAKDEKTEDEPKDDDVSSDVKALRKELKRVRAANREKEDKLESLEVQVKELAAKADTKELTEVQKSVQKLTKLADADFKRVSGEWNDELIDATAALHVAQQRGDEDAAKEQRSRIQRARNANALIDEAKEERAKASVTADTANKREIEEIETSLAAVEEDFLKALPALKDKDSEAFKAGEKEFNRHKTLMRKLGPAGQLIATAMAIIKNPKLIGRDASETRKELINNVEEAVEKGLNAGVKGGSGGGKRGGSTMPDVANHSAFEDYIERLKHGG